MSHFAKYDTKALRNREILLAALKELGLSDFVSAHEQPVTITDMGRAQQLVHVRVRMPKNGYQYANGITGVYSDWGFRREQDGTWTAIVDNLAMDTRNGKREPLGKAVEAAYRKIARDKAMTTVLTRTIPGLKAKKIIPANATAQRQVVGTQTRVVVSW